MKLREGLSDSVRDQSSQSAPVPEPQVRAQLVPAPRGAELRFYNTTMAVLCINRTAAGKRTTILGHLTARSCAFSWRTSDVLRFLL